MELIKFLKEWGALVAFLGTIGIEIIPIKIRPISWLLGKVGHLLSADLEKKVDDLVVKVHKIEKDNDFKDLMSIKNALSDYHMKLITTGLDENQYRRCFELETIYNKYKDKYPGEVNGHMDSLLETIHIQYKKNNVLIPMTSTK